MLILGICVIKIENKFSLSEATFFLLSNPYFCFSLCILFLRNWTSNIPIFKMLVNLRFFFRVDSMFNLLSLLHQWSPTCWSHLPCLLPDFLVFVQTEYYVTGPPSWRHSSFVSILIASGFGTVILSWFSFFLPSFEDVFLYPDLVFFFS